MPLINMTDLLGCLEVEQTGPDSWSARNIELPDAYRVFGGQLLAQAIAIGVSDAPGKVAKSIHVLFPREGNIALPVEFRATRLQDGRTFSNRHLVAAQGERVIFSATLSMHALEEGLEHQEAAPECSAPAACTPADLAMIPLETRIEGGVDLDDRARGPAELRFWLRAEEKLPDELPIHQAILAHCSDLTVIATALRAHAGYSVADSPGLLHTGPTSHTLWFHRPFRMDEWVLVDQRSPVAHGARAFGGANVYSENGELVASFAQESLIRVRAGS
ncbi:MAG: acyl-CoA thioesterase domain-containing protein [Myxococcota bacterium]